MFSEKIYDHTFGVTRDIFSKVGPTFEKKSQPNFEKKSHSIYQGFKNRTSWSNLFNWEPATDPVR